jgi:hypothetical protein
VSARLVPVVPAVLLGVLGVLGAAAGCNTATGDCDPYTDDCGDPWLLVCPEATFECAQERPWVCDGEDGPPSYDCERCGCPEGASCAHGFCYPSETLALVRNQPGRLPEDLAVSDYFALLDDAMGPALAYDELVAEVDRLLRLDARRAALLLGESHGSSDEQAVALQLVRDLAGRGWPMTDIGIELGGQPILDLAPIADLGISGHGIAGGLDNVAYCADALAGVGDRLNDERLYLQYTGSGHTSREICHHPQHWSICDLPHTAECVASAGRKAVTVVLFDPDPWLWLTDRTLLWRLEPEFADPDRFGAELDAALAGWSESMAAQARDPAFDAETAGAAVNVRARRALHGDDAFVAYFPRPGRPAYLLETYRAVWGDAASRAFLRAHALTPPRCSISWNLTPGEERLYAWCQRDGYELQATVDGSTFELLEASTSGPP